MAKIFIFIFVILFSAISFGKDKAFNISITIRKPLVVTVERELNFGSHELTGSDFTVTIEPDGNGSAVFQVAGSSNSTVSYTIEEEEVYLSNGTDSIKVGGFKVTGGSASGVGVITDGELIKIGVGATAFISADQPDSTYFGNATFIVTYN